MKQDILLVQPNNIKTNRHVCEGSIRDSVRSDIKIQQQ